MGEIQWAAAVAELLVHSTPRKSDEEVPPSNPPFKTAENDGNYDRIS